MSNIENGSCDTFVALPPATAAGNVIFGKNSDRPDDEVQEVIYVPAEDHPPGSKCQCTYIEIEQVAHTYAVVLSKPSWMWGAEMGANEHGVCIGNEAVWTRMESDEDKKEKLLGMDLLRLCLSRSTSAKEALHVLTSLLEEHGQGGICFENPNPTAEKQMYHNSFIICDSTEAWVVETASQFWAAEQVTKATGEANLKPMVYLGSVLMTYQLPGGVRNISNQLTIGTKIDAMSEGCKEYAKSQAWWNPDEGDFHFAKAYSSGYEPLYEEGNCPSGRQQWGTKLLQDFSKEDGFTTQNMFEVLRHKDSGICMTGGFLSAGSQVSTLPVPGEKGAAVHWFTGTPDPSSSLYKPFIFCKGATIGPVTMSPDFGDKDPAKVVPRFQNKVDRRHPLYLAQEKYQKSGGGASAKLAMAIDQMRELEKMCVQDTEEAAKTMDVENPSQAAEMFKHMAELEMNFYS